MLKKWWFWVIAVFAVLVIYGAIEGVDQAKEENAIKATAEQEVNEQETNEADEETNEEPIVVEHDDIFAFGEFTVKNIKTEITDNELTLKFSWINQSGLDMAPFTVVGYLDVSQGDEILEFKSDNPQIHDRNANGGELPVTMKYDLVSDDPIRILFGATSEHDDTKEELIIEIN